MKLVTNIKSAIDTASDKEVMYNRGLTAIDLVLSYAKKPGTMMNALLNRLYDDGLSFDNYETNHFEYQEILYRDLDEAKHFFLRDLDYLAIQLYRNGDIACPLDVYDLVGEFSDEDEVITNL